jgi:hypothetical protein
MPFVTEVFAQSSELLLEIVTAKFRIKGLFGWYKLGLSRLVLTYFLSHNTIHSISRAEGPIRRPERGESMGADNNFSEEKSAQSRNHDHGFPHELAKIT